MRLDIFIKRIVLSLVLSILIVIVGALGLSSLPISQYPDIAPPTVSVSTAYTGASAETIQKSVIAPLEEAINGVENMSYMTSDAANDGSASITVYFKQGTDPDMAAVNVQNRVSKATGLLPAEVVQVGITTAKRQNSILNVISLYSPDNSYDETFLQNYAKINIQPELLRISGVGEVMIYGSDYSMRIWLKPDVMAQYQLEPKDIVAVLGEQNIESPTGSIGENDERTFQYTMKYSGRLEHPEQFEEIVVRALPTGEVLRLKDVARVELGGLSYNTMGETDGHPSSTFMIYQTAGSNATQIIKDVLAYMEKAKKDFPKGVEYKVILDSNDFLFASIWNVVRTLLEAFILVFIIVYIFLQDIRSTLIPAIAVPVSLIGTFAVLSLAGFSINLLTLFALVLAVGVVVDDAIVVVEAVHTKLDMGYKSAMTATQDAMSDVTGAIISSTLVMMAVFIPVCFMGGTSGIFYTQFGITLAAAIGISAINALTLSPALCAVLLKPKADENGKTPKLIERFHMSFNTAFDIVASRYKNGVFRIIRNRWLGIGAVVCFATLLIFLMATTKTGLVPNEDNGTVFVNVNTMPGNSLERTSEIMGDIEKVIASIPQVETYTKITGVGLLSGMGSSYGMYLCRLKPWDQREEKGDDIQSVIGRIYGQTAFIKDAQVFAFTPAMIPGYGMSNGFELYLQDKAGGEVDKFVGVSHDFIAKLNARPEIGAAYTTFDNSFPQLSVKVDAAKCKRAGISPNAVLNAIQGYYGGLYASNFNRFGKLYRVMVQADAEFRGDLESVNNIYVRNGDKMAPISEFVTIEKVYGAQTMKRFNMFNSIAINGVAAEGYSSGDAIKAIAEVADENLPVGYGYDFGGITREEQTSTNSTAIIFIICIMFIYFILCIQYESFLLPLAIILSLPFGLAGAFIFARFMGVENNIYLQISLIMLIGLLAKSAILMIEFSLERRKRGMSIARAAILGASVRLRPILMTALTMIIGIFPLLIASGVGANGNITLGAGVVGGMLIGTILQLFVVPSLFVIFQYLQEKVKPIVWEDLDDSKVKTEIEQFV